MVAFNWTGEGYYEDGETEDYLIHVGGYDFGDAPEGSLAYPDLGVIGQFPTCINVGSPSSYIQHFLGSSYFGNAVDNEQEGNAGNCPVFDPDTYNMDECFQDGDAGLIKPSPFTISGPVGSEQVVPCQNPGSSLGTICKLLNWGSDIDINVTGTGYVNVLVDWNRDGQWTNALTYCGSNVVSEHVLQNFYITTPTMVPLSNFTPPSFRAGPYHEYVWARFTISDQPVLTDPYWDGSGTYLDGETEDYLVELNDSATTIREVPSTGVIQMTVDPNPVNDQSKIKFFLVQKGNVRIEFTDLQGKILGTFPGRIMDAGQQELAINDGGFSCLGLAGGVYVVRLMVNGNIAGYTKVIIIK
jgi:hypothetical protein